MSDRMLRFAAALTCALTLAAGCRAETTIGPVGSAPTTTAPTATDVPTAAPSADNEGVDSGTNEADIDDGPPAADGDDISADPGDVLPAPKELPPAFSTITGAGTHGFYYAATEDEMRLIAFDPVSGRGVFQISAHPLARIRGVGQTVVAHDGLGLVYVTDMTDPTDPTTARLRAHDAATGETVWSVPVDYESAQPIRCGANLCVRSIDRQLVIHPGTGAEIATFPADDRRLLIANDDLWIATTVDASWQFTGVEAIEPASDTPRWSISADDLTSFVGRRIDPANGWRGDHDADTGGAIVWLATADASALIAFGVDARGELRWHRSDLDPCVDGPVDLDIAVACVIDPATNLFAGLVRLDIATGEPLWTVPLEANHEELGYDGADLLTWQWLGDVYELERIDPTSGETRTVTDDAAPCLFVTDWVVFTYDDGTAAPWASSPNHALCGTDGFYLPRADALRAARALEAPGGGSSYWLVDGNGVPLTEVD